MALVATNFNNGFTFTGATATVGPYYLLGGRYAFAAASASWGSGSATIEILMNDGSTYVACSAPIIANGTQVLDLPEGSYEVVVSGATVFGFVLPIPLRTST